MLAAVSRLHFPVTTLGPGRRVGLWLQGCSIGCPGCISADTWDPTLGLVPVELLLDQVAALASAADGLTISGGEPFDQPSVLVAVLQRWRAASRRPILVFTGRELDEVEPWLRSNPGLLDALMTGPFRSDLPQTKALRGSDNQTLHVLSKLGEEFRSYDRPCTHADRRLDVMFDEEGQAWFAGIPARGDLGRLRRAMAAAGHKAVTSETVGSDAR